MALRIAAAIVVLYCVALGQPDKAPAASWSVASTNQQTWQPDNLPAVHVGDTVNWTIGGGHTLIVFYPWGIASSGVGTYSHLFTTADTGRYGWVCGVHAGMLGDITVYPADTTRPVSTIYPTPGTPNGTNGWYTTSVQFQLDASDPRGIDSAWPDGVPGTGVVTRQYRIDSGGYQNYTVPVTVSGAGTHTVGYRATDAVGNVEVEKTFAFKIDSAPPVTSSTVTTGGGQAQISLSANDNGGSGIASTQYRIDGGSFQTYSAPFSVSTSANHTIYYRSTDVAGNVESDKSTQVIGGVDGDAPVTTATLSPASPNGSNGWYTSAVGVTLSATDNGGTGVASTEYRVDGGAFQPYTLGFSITDPGNHTVEYRSSDSAGNIESTKSQTIRVDGTAPTSSATLSPATPNGHNAWYTSSVQVTLSASDGGISGVAGTEYRIDGGSYQPYSTPFSVGSAGNHTIDYRSTDAAGNTETAKSVSLKVDSTAPTTSATPNPASPIGSNGWYTGAVQLTLAATDTTAGVVSTEYRIDGGSFAAYTTPFSVSGAGTHTVDYRSTDAAGNVETVKTLTIRVDTDAPSTSATLSPASPNGANGWYTGAVQVTLSATDGSGTGVSLTEYRIDGGSYQPYSTPFSVGSAGNHTIDYRSTDAAGNTETAKSATFKVDATAPTTSATPSPATPNGQNGWYTGTVGVTLNVSDGTGSGVASTQYRIDGGSFTAYTTPFNVSGAGTHTIEYRSTDSAGNLESTKSQTIRIDGAAPSSSATLSPASPNGANSWYTSAVQVTLSASDGGISGVAATEYRIDGGSYQPYSSPFSVSSAGNHTIDYRSTDSAGNVETAHSVSFNIDGAAPTSSATLSPASPNGANSWYTSAVQITLSASDGGISGVASTEYRIDGGSYQPYSTPFSVSSAGSHTVDFRSTDSAGNAESAKSVTFKVDSSLPTTTASTAPGAAGSIDVTLSASDATSGTASTEYRLATSGPFQLYTGPINLDGDGSHVIQYRSTDGAGNVESTKTEQVSIDNSAPSTSAALNPASPGGQNGWYTGSVQVTLTASDTGGSGVASTEYRIDGGGYQAGSSFSVSSAGNHTIDYRSTDAFGNVETAKSLTFKIDAAAPATGASLNPVNPSGSGGWYRSAVQITLTAGDNGGSGVTGTEYRIDGGSYQPYTTAVSVSDDGSHTVDYRSIDSAGNVETAGSKSFKIDQAAPQTVLTTDPGVASGAGGSYVGSVGVSLSATDEDSGVTLTRYTLNGGEAHVVTPGTPFILDVGSWDVRFRSFDAAGNIETEHLVEIEVAAPPHNLKPPVLTGTGVAGTKLFCSPGKWTGAGTFRFAWLRNGRLFAPDGGKAYRTKRGDIGDKIKCRVSRTGSTEAVGSNAITVTAH